MRRLVMIILLSGFEFLAFGQDMAAITVVEAPVSVFEREEPEEVAFAVRPLEELIADALKFSPALQAQDMNIDNAYLKVKLMDKEWSSYLNAIGSFQVGNIRYLDNLDTDTGGEVRTITRENTFYGIGVQVRLPLYDFVTKGDRRAMLGNQLEQEKLLRQDKELRIREMVVQQYQELERTVSLIDVKNKELDFLTITADMAERYFKEGNIKLDEYTTAVSKKHRAEEALIEAKADAKLAFMVLREIVGTEIGKH